jgi:hypothetical protein
VERTRSAVDVVEVSCRVLVRPITCLTVEAWYARSAAMSLLDNHSFVEVLLYFKGALATLHELGGLGQVILARLAWFLSLRGVWSATERVYERQRK